ncbi:hypothetical protein K1W54_06820 [Micromonospora sp. CPCC 205371]|nr:hypothetical protein [Micromonospora sp. CPCC 205371]
MQRYAFRYVAEGDGIQTPTSIPVTGTVEVGVDTGKVSKIAYELVLDFKGLREVRTLTWTFSDYGVPVTVDTPPDPIGSTGVCPLWRAHPAAQVASVRRCRAWFSVPPDLTRGRPFRHRAGRRADPAPLRIPPGTPLLIVARTAATNGRALTLEETRLPADKAELAYPVPLTHENRA